VPRPHRIECPAKVNLYLDVLGKRPDGYHDLATVMVPITLFDSISVEPARRDSIEIMPEGAAPGGPDNSVFRALRALRRVRKVPPVRIRLTARILSAAGLVERALTPRVRLCRGPAILLAGLDGGIDPRIDRLDTAFFARGTAALCTGRGERVHPLAKAPSLELAILWPGTENPTHEIFHRFNHSLTPDPSKVIEFVRVVAEGDADRIRRSLLNRLEPAAYRWDPRLKRVRAELLAAGLAGARMTGSGSAFFGIGSGRAETDRAARRLKGRVFRVRTIAP
jgi:4-diphosphocytidyl-2-C-methyl-D-erythritol kinase